MGKILPLLLIMSIVVIAGCTVPGFGGPTTSGGSSNGIIINNFGPEFDKVDPNEEVAVSAEIENVGSAKATNIRTELLGLTDEWSFNPGRENPDVPNEMLPPDPDRGSPGDIAEFMWYLVPPEKKVPLDYDMELRIYYDYEAISENLLRVATRDYIKSFPSDKQQAEMDKLGVKSSSPGSGPIHVSVVARSKLLKSEGDTTYTVTLDIQNVGSGIPEDNKVGITVKSDEQTLDCGTYIEGGEVRLSQGKSKQIRCTVDVGSVDNWVDIPISVELNYRYYVSSLSSIHVMAAVIE